MQGPYKIDGCLLKNGALNFQDGNAVSNSAVFLFHASQRYSIPLSLKARKELEESHKKILEESKPTHEEVHAFNEIFCESRDIASTLRSLVQCGVIDRFIPDFSHVMRYVPPESSHS
jgi:UTP:GlnB (protein PII) uridylyltransferase